MKKGKIIEARTHAVFLNKILKIDFKGFMQCTYPYDEDLIIWFIRLNGKEGKYGWTNTLVSENEIKEEYTGDLNKKIGYPKLNKRVIFNIVESGSKREYIFLGIFKMEGSSNKRIWKMIKDELNFPYDKF